MELVIEKIIALMGLRLKPEVRNETSNEIRYQMLSAVKVRSEFGWRPRFSLDEGLQTAIAWYRENLRGKVTPIASFRITTAQLLDQ